MPRRATLVRLLVTAFLCVASLARPPSGRADPAGVRRDREPMHVSAAALHAELTRLGRRLLDEQSGDAPGLLDEHDEHHRAFGTIASGRATAPSWRRSDHAPMVRARGPPA